jgi:hypothetical protein
MSSPSLSTILGDHVSLPIGSFDRLYLGGTCRRCRQSGQGGSHEFAAQPTVPVVHFVRGPRMDTDHREWHAARLYRDGGAGSHTDATCGTQGRRAGEDRNPAR